MMTAVATIKITAYIHDCTGSEINEVKYPSCAAACPSPVRNATIYLAIQPPITA